MAAMMHGGGNLRGLAELPGVTTIGGAENPAHEGLVSLTVAGRAAPDVVTALRDRGTHTRKADNYSGNAPALLGLEGAVRISMCHYNTESEVARFLLAMREITERAVV